MSLFAAVNVSSVVQGSEDFARSQSQLTKRESNNVRGGGARPVREGPLDKVFPPKDTSGKPVDGGVLSDSEQLKDQELVVTEDFKKSETISKDGRRPIHESLVLAR